VFNSRKRRETFIHVQSADTGFEVQPAFQPKDIRRFLSRDNNAVRA
jgi:hypothetical protein